MSTPAEKSRWRDTAVPLGGLWVVLAWCIGLLIFASAQNRQFLNERVEQSERLGSEVVAQSRAIKAGTRNDIELTSTSDSKLETATWSLSSYEFAHNLPRARRCDASIVIFGDAPQGLDRHSSARIVLEGRSVAVIAFTDRLQPQDYARPDQPEISGTAVRPFFKSAIFRPNAVSINIGSHACATRAYTISLLVRGVSWHITGIAVSARFTPSVPSASAERLAITSTAVIEIVLFTIALGWLLQLTYERHGTAAVAYAVAICCLSTITHDEWDFPVWLRFADLFGFGHAMPSHMWAGTPLWAFVPTLFWPLEGLTSMTLDNSSQEVVALFLKLAMAMSVIVSALVVATLTRLRFRQLTFAVVLLAPIGLYELAGGYREIFAGMLAVIGLAMIRQCRLWLAAAAFALATSISESMLPLVMVPSAFALLRTAGPRWRAFGLAGGLLATIGIVIALQWIVLLPHALATSAVSQRIASYRFGGASWFGALSDLGVLPTAIGTHVTTAMLVIVSVLVLPIFLRLAIDGKKLGGDRAALERRIVDAALALLIVLYLAYAGIDPNDWYALFIVIAAAFAIYRPTSMVPALLAFTMGLGYYVIVGLYDFVDSFYIAPRNSGLLGTLGHPVDCVVLTVDGLLVALYVALLADRTDWLFSRNSPLFFVLFVAGFCASAVRYDVNDVVFIALVVLASSVTLWRLYRLDVRTQRPDHGPFRLIAIGALMLIAPFAGQVAGGSTTAATIALIAGVRRGFALCDVVLVFSVILEFVVQPSFGWVSIFGYFMLSIVAVVAILRLRLPPAEAVRSVAP